jgi:putative DNA primase/helicase
MTLAQSQEKIGLTGKEWDIAPLALPVKNGLIDLRAGSFRPTTPADYVRTFAPVEWRGLNEPAPVWEKTLLEIFSGDPDLVNFARRLVGYMITGLTKEQILAILYGTGSNGKSLFVDVLAAVLGESFVFPTQAEAIMEAKYSDGNAASPYVYAMRGKRLVLASEGKEGQKLNTGLVKQLTGDRLITARPLFGNPVTFQQTHKIMLITNHLPSIPDSEDYAIWRRIMPLPFDVQFLENPTQANERKINKDLPELLKKEYSGILAWCVRGALEWQAQGLAAPAKVKNATEHYKDAEDPIAQFIDERMNIGAKYEVLAKAAYGQFKQFCEDNDYTPVGSKTFYGRLTKKYGAPKHQNTGNYYQGIGLII